MKTTSEMNSKLWHMARELRANFLLWSLFVAIAAKFAMATHIES